MQIRPSRVGTEKVRAFKARISQAGFPQIRVTQVSLGEIRSVEKGLLELHPYKNLATEVLTAQIRALALLAV